MTWKKGQSGNPLGRASARKLKHALDLEKLAREHSAPAIKALVDVMRDKQAPHSARVSAATVILERGYGKPKQDVTVKGSIEHHIAKLVAGLDSPQIIDGDGQAVDAEGQKQLN